MKKPSLFEILFKKDEHKSSHELMAKTNFFSRELSGSVSMQAKKRRGKRSYSFDLRLCGNNDVHSALQR